MTWRLPMADKSDAHALRQFARGFSLMLVVVFMGVLPYITGAKIPWWPLYVASALLLLDRLCPMCLYPAYWTWMLFASVLNWVNTRLLLAFVFFAIMLPIGCFMRWRGKLQFVRSSAVRANAISFWHEPKVPLTKENLKEPF